MNILMINYEYPPLGGGGGVFNKQLAEELAKKHRVTVITSTFHHQNRSESINNVDIRRVPLFFRDDQNAATIASMLSFFPASLWAGYKLLRANPFDIIHSFFAIPSAPSGFLLARKFAVPHVLSLLGGDIYDPSKHLSPHKTPILHQAVKIIIEKSDSVASLSMDIKQRVNVYYGVSKNIATIHLGIPQPTFVGKERSAFGFSPEDILLVTVGRLVRRKAVHELIAALQVLRNANVKLIVIGDGPERSNLEQSANSSAQSPKVIFVGNVSNELKFQLLAISDIFVSSSQHEGFGIVFLEAMALGLPIVCYDRGGQADYLRNRDTGFLVRYGDAPKLAESIELLCRNVELRLRMGKFNREYSSNFRISTSAGRYETLYNCAISKNTFSRAPRFSLT